LRASLPKIFPYFYVEFTLDSGYAHIVEDERDFPEYFGREIIASMLNLSPRKLKHSKRETMEEQQNRVSSFVNKWNKHDWTKLLG